ncbi:uncharacterized protein LOC141618420 [Silene latifolia]|uniref:uncharacterized protein LOC141618420 n=1 Tax=Silene latifolia TaxID=37657 RepID=UPI003D77B0C1
MRWVLLLSEFDIEIKDKQGSANVVAGHLSRLHINEDLVNTMGVVVGSLPHESLYAMKVVEPCVDEAGLHRKLQIQEMEELRLDSYDNAAIYKEKARVWHDKMIARRSFKEGDKVLLFQNRFKLFPGKLRSRLFGPYIVKKVHPHGAMDVETPNSGKLIKVNGQRIKVYHERM